jgi:hypothetical protein
MQSILYNKSRKAVIISAAVLLFTLAGCFFGVQRDDGVQDRLLKSFTGEPVIPREANKIFVRDFENGKTAGSLAGRLTIRVKELIASDGRLGVVEDETMADLSLQGKMVSYELQALKFDEMGTVIEKRMRSVVRLRLIDVMHGRDVFTNERVESFVVFSDRVPPVESESGAQDRLLEEMSKRIVAQAVTGWYTKYMTPAEKGKR